MHLHHRHPHHQLGPDARHGHRLCGALIAITLAVALAGCGKATQGEQGEPGPAGPSGPKGDAGPRGPAGASGSMREAAVRAPSVRVMGVIITNASV